MFKPVLAAVAALAFAQPALAGPLNAYSVYSDTGFDVAGGAYGPVACSNCGETPPGDAYSNAGAAVGALSNSSAALTLQATQASTYYKNLLGPAGTPYTITGPNDFNKTLTGIAGVNVVNFTPAEIGDIEIFLQLAPPGITQLIFNIPGLNVNAALFEIGLPAGLTADKVLFNFYEATKVTGTGRNIHGTILAPKALVDISGLTVDGIIISRDFNAANVNVLGNGFIFGPAVPEPATWAMMILGFALIGGALRRRTATRPALAA